MGFPLSEVRQHVHVRHGTRDWQVPAAMGRALTAMLPHCTAHWYAGEGHFRVFDHAEEVHAALRPQRPGVRRRGGRRRGRGRGGAS